MITVYTKPLCVQCDSTKLWLTREGVDFEVKEIAENPEVLDEAKAKSILRAPIVAIDGEVAWGGFDIFKLREFKKQLAAQASG